VKRIIALSVSILLIGFSAANAASTTDLGLITGGERGTYHQFGLDLQRLVKPAGINLRVFPSKGSVQNMEALHQKPGIQLGIVQSDVLAFVAGLQSTPALAQLARSTRMVFPLHNEDVHVLGRHGIADFDDLAGRRVAIGREGSGSFLTARLLFKLSGIRPSEVIPIDAGEALAQLKAGQIDAMVYVAGYPVRFLKDDVTASDGLALIPISSKSILEAYDAVEIPANVYEWQSTAVSTVAVKALLVTYDVRGRHCDSVGLLAQQIAKGMSWLTKNGHPRWKLVDLDAPLKGWEQYDCVQKYLGKHPGPGSSPSASPGEQNPVTDAIRGILGNN
jgi:TRAP transporter TAXI family solute receptor